MDAMKSWGLGVALSLVAAPALADVKAGVDAWERGDFAKAIGEWRAPAAKGDADAQFNLAQAYKLGRGVPRDPVLAQEWFRKAAVQGHPQAEDNYGLALFEAQRRTEAAPWLEKSAARDERRSQLVLGTMLFNGDGVPKDWTRAYALVTRSSQQGLPQASQTLVQMDKYLPEAQRQQGIALAATYARSPASIRTAEIPPSASRPISTPRAAPPTPRPTPKAAPVRVAASGGAWRIQLGAFREDANARALWAKVGGRTGGSAAYVKGGGVTRLQATGFANKAAANAACAKAGATCVVVAP